MNAYRSIKFLTFILCIAFPLSPFLLNGAPYIGDAWIHLKIAEETLASSHYQLIDYNEKWPLINFLLIFIMAVTSLKPILASQIIPFLAGLTILPLYAFCRRLKLSEDSSIAAILFLTFNPLYSYVTFASAVMKETAAYYLISSMLLAIALNNLKKALVLLIGLGIVLGHHFGALTILIFFFILAFYAILYRLKGKELSLKNVLAMALGFTIVFSIWNINNYLALRQVFSFIKAEDLALLPALIILSAYSLYSDKGLFSARKPWLIALAFLIAVLGLRGGVYALLQPTPPITIWEVRNYALAGALSLIGLAYALKNVYLKAYASASISLTLFAFLYGLTPIGFTLLIKSLHYFGLLLALGAGFFIQKLLKQKLLGKISALSLILFIIYASSFGTALALNGLGAYRAGEVQEAFALKRFIEGLKAYGDTRASYLLPYASNISIQGLKPLKSEKSFFILFKPNWEQGFLIGYDWIPKNSIITDEELIKWNKLWDSLYLKIYG
jgi:hypothetical protein